MRETIRRSRFPRLRLVSNASQTNRRIFRGIFSSSSASDKSSKRQSSDAYDNVLPRDCLISRIRHVNYDSQENDCRGFKLAPQTGHRIEIRYVAREHYAGWYHRLSTTSQVCVCTQAYLYLQLERLSRFYIQSILWCHHCILQRFMSAAKLKSLHLDNTYMTLITFENFSRFYNLILHNRLSLTIIYKYSQNIYKNWMFCRLKY